MNILFLSYWELDEGLSAATVIPHLKILSEIEGVNKVVYCSIERTKKAIKKTEIGPGIVHIPLFTGKSYLHKIFDFIVIPLRLGQIVKEYSIDSMICRGAPAGSLGHLVNRNMGVSYVVESFEPHAQYMVESGVWHPGGLKYQFQRKWEKAQLRTAKWIVTVSRNYRNHLLGSGVSPNKVLTVPCAVDLEKFSYNESTRDEVREKLSFSSRAIIGIYTGKFGGLYYDQEAFEIFAMAFRCIEEFKLIILTPDDQMTITNKLIQMGIPRTGFFVGYANHNRVSDYLSAADFAFATYKPSPSKMFLSPVKVGEYWANGLPVLLTDGVGDDSEIMKEGGGITFSFHEHGSVLQALKTLESLVRTGSRQKPYENISALAVKYRNFERVKEIYKIILTK